jgi:glutaredoxin 3
MKVTIYSMDKCLHCTRAKMLLTARGMPYTELKLDEDFSREHLKELFPSATTFPVIVVDGFNIGGYDQLDKMLNEQIKETGKFLTEG